MTVAFLRGRRVILAPLELRDPSWRERLVQTHARGHADEVELMLVTPEGAPWGRLALGPLDWRARSAGLAGEAAPEAPPDAWREALALAVRYAFDELNLDAVHARPVDDAAADALLAAGAQRDGAHHAWKRTSPPRLDIS